MYTVSNLDVPVDGCDEVDADAFWENVALALVGDFSIQVCCVESLQLNSYKIT
jgi:hypothetical protein